jgi:hypothetical protein
MLEDFFVVYNRICTIVVEAKRLPFIIISSFTASQNCQPLKACFPTRVIIICI